MANEIEVNLDLDTLEAIRELGAFAKKAQVGGEKAGNSFAKGFGQSLLGNIGANVFGAAFRRVGTEIGKLVDSAKGVEVIETQFKTLLGTTEAAEKQLSDLQNFAASTPFQLEGLSLATRQLLSFGVAQEDIIPTLARVGELASGVGVSIDELTIPYGRLISTQKLSLVELDKFADKGAITYQQLADKAGTSIKTIRDEISKGKIPFETFTEVLKENTSEGGLFFQSMVKQSTTLEGRFSTLSDTIFNLRSKLGKLFTPVIKKTIEAITKSLGDLDKTVSGISVQDVQQQFISFNQGVIDYLIRPLELFANVGKFVFDGVKLAIQGLVSSLGFVGGKIAEFMENFGVENEGLKDFAKTSSEVFDEMAIKAGENLDSLFDTPIAEKAEIFNTELAGVLDTTNDLVAQKTAERNEILNKSLDKTLKNGAKAEEKLKKTAQRLNQQVTAAVAGGISKSIQSVVTSLQNGEDAFSNFGKLVLGVVGDLAIKLGETLILSGVGIESLKALGGTAAIAAGAGLVAIGTILKNASGGAGGISGSSGSGGGGNTAGALATGDDRDVIEEDDVEERRVSSTINIEVQGSLVQQEELGRFIAEVQNESREKNGLIDTNVRTA